MTQQLFKKRLIQAETELLSRGVEICFPLGFDLTMDGSPPSSEKIDYGSHAIENYHIHTHERKKHVTIASPLTPRQCQREEPIFAPFWTQPRNRVI
jgi:hypothetical protein